MANLAAAATFAFVVAIDGNTRPSVWMCHKRYVVHPQYPQNADSQLRNDQAFCTNLQGELKKTIFGMCTMNPTEAGKPSRIDTKVDLMFKYVFCNYL